MKVPEGDRPLWDLFEIYRNYIIHEDDLIASRTGRFFSVQSVLFGGYAALNIDNLKQLNTVKLQETMQKIQFDGSNLGYDDVLAGMVALFGLVAAIASMNSLLAARNALSALREKWELDILGSEGATHPLLPDITGGGAKHAHRRGMWLWLVLPPITMLAWAVVLFCHAFLLP
jgi:hypothetical protein